MTEKQYSLPLNDSEGQELSDNDGSDYLFYYKNDQRKIAPVIDKTINEIARKKLSEIKEKEKNLPRKFVENWERVKLYHAKGNINEAKSIILHLEDGSYDLRNSLNHLTGKEWTKFTSSWFIFNALHADLKEEREVTPDTQSHPATFSPTMTGEFISFFTKEGESVIDPFAGIGSTLVACKRTNRVGYGIELNSKYFEIITKRVPQFSKNIFNVDARYLDTLGLPEIDYSISSPPYWDVLNRSTDGFENTRKSNGLDVNYSQSANDLGNINDYSEFLEQVCSVYLKLFNILKKGSYITIIVKNIKKGGKLYPLAWDMARTLGEKYSLKDEKIWIQDKIALSPYGYPFSWASNIIHHYCINLRKE